MKPSRISTVGWLIFVAGYLLLAWSAWYLGESTYMRWKHGVQKTAHVLSLSHTSSGYGGGVTYYYNIEVDGSPRQKGFRVRLPVGQNVSILEVPGHPDFLEVGTRADSLFDLWSIQLGGPVMGLLVLGMFAFMTVTAPRNFRILWAQRPKLLGGNIDADNRTGRTREK
jgi:hypothetical protein